MRRAALVAAATLIFSCAAGGGSALAGDPFLKVHVLRVDGVGLDRLLDLPSARLLSRAGGAALLAHVNDLDGELAALGEVTDVVVDVERLGADEAGLAALDLRLHELLGGPSAPDQQLWVISGGSGQPNDELGAVIVSAAAWSAGVGPRSLTSDSTRRDGVVIVEDLIPTMCALGSLPCPPGLAGSVMEPVDVPPPLSLYTRYLANRRMSVPIQTAAGLYVAFAGLFAVAVLAGRRRVPPELSWLGAWTAISVIPLALSLLLAGHLPELSYATVLAAVVGGTALGTVAFVPVACARGTLEALAWVGGVTLAVFVLEAVLGWTAALHTFLGGTEMDGGRFYGLPNVDIGLLLGAAAFVANRLRPTAAGVALFVAVALFAGLPFAGANLGAAVTLAAAAGLWWGLRDGRGAIPTGLACFATAGAGLLIVLVLNRVLPGPPTHITNFVEGQGGGVLATVVRRLGTGIDLIVRNPLAIVPVIGVGATLIAVLRPAEPIRASFARHPGWREALLTILWGSVVAYIANDTGAAAVGLGFGTALGGVLFVSLRDRPWMMVET